MLRPYTSAVWLPVMLVGRLAPRPGLYVPPDDHRPHLPHARLHRQRRVQSGWFTARHHPRALVRGRCVRPRRGRRAPFPTPPRLDRHRRVGRRRLAERHPARHERPRGIPPDARSVRRHLLHELRVGTRREADRRRGHGVRVARRREPRRDPPAARAAVRRARRPAVPPAGVGLAPATRACGPWAAPARPGRGRWQPDVVGEGDRELQRVIHAMLFYLRASVREGTDESLPPMGLSSPGYFGHVFWDADTWMFPPVPVLHPEIARSMVGFRYRALGAARRNAARNGYRGAMYPWESDELGDEATPRFAWQNALYENHVTGDVALAQWQYYLATGDSAWLARYGYPVLAATAAFLASRATFHFSTGRHGIGHVVSVDDGLIGIRHDTYTNAIARQNLEV